MNLMIIGGGAASMAVVAALSGPMSGWIPGKGPDAKNAERQMARCKAHKTMNEKRHCFEKVSKDLEFDDTHVNKVLARLKGEGAEKALILFTQKRAEELKDALADANEAYEEALEAVRKGFK